jgi:hypothetical protein
LRPNIKKGGWTKEEEAMIHYYHEMFGPKWSAMAQVMKNRTDNDIKNKFYSMNRSAQRKKHSAGTPVVDVSVAGNLSPMDIASGCQRSSGFFNRIMIEYGSEHVKCAMTEQQSVQPLYVGNSIFDVPARGKHIAPTASDGGNAGGGLCQHHSTGILGADFWENNLDF